MVSVKQINLFEKCRPEFKFIQSKAKADSSKLLDFEKKSAYFLESYGEKTSLYKTIDGDYFVYIGDSNGDKFALKRYNRKKNLISTTLFSTFKEDRDNLLVKILRKEFGENNDTMTGQIVRFNKDKSIDLFEGKELNLEHFNKNINLPSQIAEARARKNRSISQKIRDSLLP